MALLKQTPVLDPQTTSSPSDEVVKTWLNIYFSTMAADIETYFSLFGPELSIYDTGKSLQNPGTPHGEWIHKALQNI